MREYLPLLILGAILGVFTVVFVSGWLVIRRQKEAVGFDRNMKDGEIVRRLSRYAKPHWKAFLCVGLAMLFSVAYDVISPLIVGDIEEMIKADFAMSALLSRVAVYAGILAVSLVSTYAQAILLQRTGQKILSAIRLELFEHIERLSHSQLNAIPVGKLVTRVTNDTGAISMMFTNIFVNLVKNAFVIVGVLAAMLLLNYELTLMILCFVPFIFLFTLIFGLLMMVYSGLDLGSKHEARYRTLHITVPEDLDYTGVFADLLARYTTENTLTQVKTTNMGSLFRLTYNITLKDAGLEKEMIDELRKRNGNLEISLSLQENMASEL